MSLLHHTHCPVCNSENIHPLLTVTDHSVSKQHFVVWQCLNCTLRFTQDVPDEASIGAYYQSENYISHTNSSKGLVNRMYQKVRNYTLHGKASLIMKHTGKKGSLLDMGAGTGAFAATMRNLVWNVTGIEPDEGARQLSKKLFHIDLLDFHALGDLHPRSFDAITLWHVLEHVHALHDYMEKLKSLLRPGGKLFIAVPNYDSVDNTIYKLYWAAYDVPRHLYHFTPKAIELLAMQHGLRLLEKKPMWFDAFYISLLSTRYRTGKERWIGAGISGLRSTIAAALNKDRSSSLIYILEKDQRSN